MCRLEYHNDYVNTVLWFLFMVFACERASKTGMFCYKITITNCNRNFLLGNTLYFINRYLKLAVRFDFSTFIGCHEKSKSIQYLNRWTKVYILILRKIRTQFGCKGLNPLQSCNYCKEYIIFMHCAKRKVGFMSTCVSLKYAN